MQSKLFLLLRKYTALEAAHRFDISTKVIRKLYIMIVCIVTEGVIEVEVVFFNVLG